MARCAVRNPAAAGRSAAIGILRAAFLLGVAQMQVVGSVGRQGGGESGIGVMRVQTGAPVLMIVVEGQLVAGGVGDETVLTGS